MNLKDCTIYAVQGRRGVGDRELIPPGSVSRARFALLC